MHIRQPVKKKIRTHSHRQDLGISFLFGAAAMWFTRGQGGILFSLGVGLTTMAFSAVASFLYQRSSTIKSVSTQHSQLIEPKNEADKANTTPQKRMQLPKVRDKHLNDKIDPNQIQDDDLFFIGFCIKRGFAEWIEGPFIKQSPLKHSSIIFVPMHIMHRLKQSHTHEHDNILIQEQGIIVFGRQSTVFRASNNKGIKNSSMSEIKNTEIDNEMRYSFFPGAPFEPMMSEVMLTGKEIKAIINHVDEVICRGRGQLCDMINSNCYSASVCMLATAIQVLNKRYHNQMEQMQSRVDIDLHPGASANTYKQIKDLCFLMLDVLKHNYGQGVLNNPAVIDEVNLALDIAKEFDHGRSMKLINFHLSNGQDNANTDHEIEITTKSGQEVQFKFY